MALILADRVKETTTTTGTGTVTLLGAAVGYQSFTAAIGNGNTTYYVIAGQTTAEWEVGIGTYTSSGTTLARTTVLDSSNSGSLVNFSSGVKDVWVDYPADKAVYKDASNTVPAIYDTSTASTGYFALPTGTTAQRPGSPANGYTRFNTTLNAIETYSTTNGKWEIVVYFTNPNAPTIGIATTVTTTSATVTYTAPANTGAGTSTQAITSYTAVSSPGGITGTVSQAGSGTITVSGLTPATSYTFTVYATNGAGNSASSAASNSITTVTVPGAPTIGTASFNVATATASITYTAPANNGASTITSYTAVSSPGGITGSVSQAGSGTINVTGLTNYTAYTFTVYATNAIGDGPSSAASNSITPRPNTYSVSYLTVAGGGCGGGQNGGGGGAGGMITGTSTLTFGTTYSVVVGAGGISAQGGTTTALGLTLVGGGVGTGGSGGSGAGGFPGAGGAGTAGQGNNGGSGINSGSFPAGGGGGKGAVGGNAPNSSTGGTGGAGASWAPTGATYAGGGGGGVNPGSGGPGGAGGGGPGSTAASSPTPGTANTGGGGGGGNNNRAGTGGSGIVIFEIPTGSYTGTTTGSPTISTVGGNTQIKFTGSGSYTA